MRTTGSFRYISNIGHQRKEWTPATLSLSPDSNAEAIIADLQDTEYESLDMPESRQIIPLKQFRLCRKRVLSTYHRQKVHFASVKAELPSLHIPIFQVYMASRAIFATRQLWIGFDSSNMQETWYVALRTIVCQPLFYWKYHVRAGNTKQLATSDATQAAELDILAAALPSMIDNEIYESSKPSDNIYTAIIVPTEKSKELSLQGQYLLRITSVTFELLDPICHAVIRAWPIKFIRKFGVNMKRLYLFIGSGCECGQGLLIFLVDDAFTIHNKLILLTRQETCSSQLSRRVIQAEPLPTCSLQEDSVFVNTFKSSSYWFPQDSVYPFRLTSPLSIDKAVMVTEAERFVDAKSSTQDLPETEEVREVATQVEPSNDSLEKAGETYCENSCDSELESIFETVTASAVVQCGESMLSKSIYNSTAAEQDTISEVDKSSGQPLYANTEQLANAAFCSSEPLETATQRNGRTRNRNVVSGPKRALEHQLQISCSEDDRKGMEMWRTRYPFEPIEETEELLSKSDSTSTLKENEDTTHLVTSSTPGDEATLGDELFHFKGPSIETDVQPDCKKDNLNVLNVRAKSRRPQNFLSRSATWDGWMLEEAAAKMLCKRKQDVAVQTDSDDETAGNDSDIVIRTVL